MHLLHRRQIVALAFMALGAGTAACQPCAGVVGCSDEWMTYQGRIVLSQTGGGLPGTTVAFVRTGGAALSGDPAPVITDPSGSFILTFNPIESGPVVGDFLVQAPGEDSPYRIPGITLEPQRRGSPGSLGVWRDRPIFIAGLRIVFRADGSPASGAAVSLIRTGGVIIDPDTLHATANADGSFWVTAMPAAVGTVQGELVVRMPGEERVLRRDGVEIPVIYRFPELATNEFAVGPGVLYLGRVLRPDGSPLVGAAVEMRRTGGLELKEDEEWTVTTSSEGVFPIFPVLADRYAHGSFTVEVTVHPGDSFASFTRELILESHELPEVPRLDPFRIGSP
jgi:hypothetical protein